MGFDGSGLTFCDRVRDDEIARASFIALAKKVFGLDFGRWYALGWWGNDYIPHALFDGNRAVANVSVNVIQTRLRGEMKRFIQLGTVMTDPDYRGLGLARRLMEAVLDRYAPACDGVYLYANDSVVDFYPKFGFVPAQEYVCARPVAASGATVRKMDMDDPSDRALLLRRYAEGNPFSALPLLGNAGLLMFYCAQFLRDCVYELPGAVAVAEYDGDGMLLYDVFGSGCLDEILSALARPDTKTCTLGFSPLSPEGFDVRPRREADTTLFVLGGRENPFERDRLMFPLLSHA
jgi:GNAT superfamily N-acetyltransferase